MNTKNITVFCKGIGCTLKSRCQRFGSSLSVKHDHSITLIQSCDTDTRMGYLPSATFAATL